MPFRDRIARALPWLAAAVVVIGFVNFFWFMAESLSVGDANQGRIVDGHYFLGNKGTFTEVTRAAWEWSQFHGASIIVTHLAAMASGGFLLLRRVFPAQMAGSASADPELVHGRIELVRASGPILHRASIGGRVGPVRLSKPLLEVSVHPNGLVVRAKLMSEHAILAAEIVDVRKGRSVLQDTVEIEHLGVGSKSPLLLYRSIDDPIVLAIRKVAADASALTGPIAAPTGSSGDSGPPPGRPARWSLAGQPAIPGIDPRLSTIMEVAGLGVGVVLLAMGALWAIPKLGGFGIIWTVATAAILAWNGTRFIGRHFVGSPRPAGSKPGDDPEG